VITRILRNDPRENSVTKEMVFIGLWLFYYTMADVLLVEDTDIQVALLERFVAGRHEVVGTAATSTEAIELADATAPDVVLMDLALEEGSGIEATAAITDSQPTTSVIISTVGLGTDTKERAMAAGADAYLTKPYSSQELLETIDQVLS